MAIDQTPTTSETVEPPIAAIENELPAYRAISSTAILSVVLGVASVFCFTDLWFLLVVAASVAVGVFSLRKIRQLPDVLTGASYARVGIGLGLLFGLSALVHSVSEHVVVYLDARNFSNHLIEVIKDQPVSLALWYEQPPEFRSKKTPDEIADEIKKSRNPMTADPYGEKVAGIQKIKDRLKVDGQKLQFSKVESSAIDGLTIYANTLLVIDGPTTKEYPSEQYVLVQMVKSPKAGRLDWVVKDFRFPYTPASATVALPEKKHDDGHGH